MRNRKKQGRKGMGKGEKRKEKRRKAGKNCQSTVLHVIKNRNGYYLMI